MITGFTADENGIVTKALSEYALKMARLAASRKNAGSDKAEHRARLRELSRKAGNLAREFEKEI
jgi:hypothetical protein